MEVPIVKKRKESFESALTEGKMNGIFRSENSQINIRNLILYFILLDLEHRVKRRLSEENKINNEALNKELEKHPSEAISVVHTMKPVHNNNSLQRNVLLNDEKNIHGADMEMKDDEPIQSLYPQLNNNINEDQFEYVAMNSDTIVYAAHTLLQTPHQRAAALARLD